ncbi:MAG: hypothetical protein GY696_05340 [Gammaproteobacteria bacterium]|nr:hypothetical protein [Gammaproteobacteria bacterium]
MPKKTDGATPTPTTRPKLIRYSLYERETQSSSDNPKSARECHPTPTCGY